MKALIIGGTSGLGLELAKLFKNDYEVVITGRNDPNEKGMKFEHLDIGPSVVDMSHRLIEICGLIEPIDLIIYAAGYFQEGTIGELMLKDIVQMNNVGFLAPAILINRVMERQDTLPGFIAVTSTSQWTPRRKEPVYTGVKGGLGMFASSLSLDPHIEKVLVAGPAGMKTKFWSNSVNDTSKMLDPVWVAFQIYDNFKKHNYLYRFIKILREPARVEVAEERS